MNGELLEILDVNKLVPNFFEVKNVYSKGDNVTIECTNMFNMYVNLNIDTNTMLNSVEETGKLASFDFADNWKTDYYNENGDLLRPESEGIYKGDELICNFSNSYGNPALLKSGCIIDATDDRYVMIVRYLDTHKINLYFISFDKASENPNEGKTVLTAGFTGDIDFAIGTAISEFNKTNSDYFVVAKSYKLDSNDIQEIDSENEHIEKDKDEYDPLFFLDGSEIKLNSYITLKDIKYYLYSNPMMNDIAFTGLPSTDGRGPSVTAGGSVAISKSCCDLEGAKAFVKSFLTNESIYSHVSENPILISACRSNSIDIINLSNSFYEEQSKYTSEAELNSFGLYYCDLEVADKYIDILKTADCNTSADANVMIIINEEIQAYFAGQKSIDSVIKIIQDRAQTVIDER